jgi:exopolyphosphatase/guanosine-5'-triphosphate,3'-diphosphate pyrophosphatase
MKWAIIDIGSNSIRLAVFEAAETGFKILFKEKIMAGLAGYVEDGALSAEGIECACRGLLEFREMLESLGIEQVAVLATASLRNIGNTEEAVSRIKTATGYRIDVLSGEEEAMLGYVGAMREIHLTSGAFMDIGGASTELVSFENGRPLASVSFPIGSLNLYRRCVKKIWPGKGSLKRMENIIVEEIEKKRVYSFDKRSPLTCVGGTARAVLNLSKKLYALSPDCRSVSRAQLDNLCALLYQGDYPTVDLILKLEPDRIYTLVPGAAIMQHIAALFDSDEIVVSKYGVREGYLCQRILQTDRTDTHIPKIES